MIEFVSRPQVVMSLTADEKPNHSMITATCLVSPDHFRRFLFTVVDELTVIGMSLPLLDQVKMDVPIDAIDKAYKEHVDRGVLPDNVSHARLVFSQSSNTGKCLVENDHDQTIVIYVWKWII